MAVYVLSVNSAVAVLNIDVLQVEQYVQNTLQDAHQHNEKMKASGNILSGDINGNAALIDTMNNGFANEIIRNQQTENSVFNSELKQQSTPIDTCDDLSVSDTLNQLTCNALEATSQESEKFISDLTQPIKVGHDHVADSITNPMTITVETAPKILNNAQAKDQLPVLREQAFKSTANSAMKASTEDQKNIYNTLSNSAIDSFSTDSLKDITESTTRAYVIRKLVVMKAKEIYALMLNYKHQLQKEQVLATDLLQLNSKRLGGQL
ncbi:MULTISPECIES: hypothetical protein [Cysteiniphilum]|nr:MULTISPECIES: hypothetical protein [Cysteiniphilum]